MNIKQKNNRLVQILFFVLPIIFSQNIFGNNNSEMKETVIKISDIKIFESRQMQRIKAYHSKGTNPNCYDYPIPTEMVKIEFKEPGTQKITIENHLAKDVDIGHMFFIGDEFTAPLIARSISIEDSSCFTTIKAGEARTLMINAKENASATINPEGEQMLLSYKIAGDKEDKFFKLKIKLNYNDDIFFKVRNLKFLNERVRDQCEHYPLFDTILDTIKPSTFSLYDFLKPEARELVLINNNQQDSVHIKSVKFGREGVSGKIDNSACSTLKSNESCAVNISMDYTPKNDVVPILITYDIIGKEAKKDLIAIAAAIVNYAPKNHATKDGQSAQALLNGAATGVSGVMAGLISKAVFVIIIGDKFANIVTKITDGPLAGAAFSGAGKLVNSFGKYDDVYGYNKIIDASIMHLAFAAVPCTSLGMKASAAGPLAGVATGSICMAASISCGLAGTFGGTYVTEAFYSNIVNRLPEQLWDAWLWDKSKSAFNFGASAVIRMGCKIALSSFGIIDVTSDPKNPDHHDYFYNGGLVGGLIEVGQDTSSGATMTVIDKIASSEKSSNSEDKNEFNDVPYAFQ